MIIFCENKSSRSEYAIRTFLTLAGIDEVLITLDENEFLSSFDSKINYTSKNITCDLQIVPNGLLFEKGVKSIQTEIHPWGNTFCFFKNSNSKIPFDIFSATFWLLSRYEEYLPYIPDSHSRYSGKNSFLFKNNLLLRPLIDEWCSEFRKILSLPDLQKKVIKNLTIDVDNAFAFLHKGFIRNTGGSVRNLIKGDLRQISDRRKVLKRKMNDPFDTYDYIIQQAKENNTTLRFFFLLGDRAKNDTNLSHQIPEFQQKIREIASQAECGIHPSYQSFLNKDKVKTEIQRLENIIGKKVKISRQHFLRMKLPETYQILNECGIIEEHTMGFADEPGYRAGTSFPFFWYDLKNEAETKMKIFPFVMMDATLKRYLSLTPEKAIEYSKCIYNDVKDNNGHFTLLWHNESVNDYWKWKNWKKVFEAQMQMS